MREQKVNVYLTVDRVGSNTGGGIVTYNELEALKSLGETIPITVNHAIPSPDPFHEDREILWRLQRELKKHPDHQLGIAHCYAGCLSETVHWLKANNWKVTYTCAAHDIEISKREHEKLGVPFTYPHLVDPELWQRYSQGYRDADVLIVPSSVSAKTVTKQGRTGRIEVISHGVNLPEKVVPLPSFFKVGYLGAIGPDKGIIYLLQAWKKLNYKDAMLVIAGRQSTDPCMVEMVKKFGGGSVHLLGWVENVSDFYNGVSLYIQPSCTEGFGIEVAEAMSHGRLAICSEGAGASDVVAKKWRFPAADPDALAEKIQEARKEHLSDMMGQLLITSRFYTWDEIRQKYVDLWRNL